LGLKGGTGYTPLAQLLAGGFRKIFTTTLSSSVTLKHDMGYLTPGLQAHTTVAYDDSYAKGYAQLNSVPMYSAMRDPANPANIIFVGGQVNPSYTADNLENTTWRKIYLEAAMDYNRTFGDHTVSALVLANAQRYTGAGARDTTPSRSAYRTRRQWLRR